MLTIDYPGGASWRRAIMHRNTFTSEARANRLALVSVVAQQASAGGYASIRKMLKAAKRVFRLRAIALNEDSAGMAVQLLSMDAVTHTKMQSRLKALSMLSHRSYHCSLIVLEIR